MSHDPPGLLERAAAAVGCGHCQRLGADESCAICGRPVCPACTAPSSCSEPVAQELRLGTGRRLWQLDDEGRVGLVTSWSGRRRWLIDLERFEVVRELSDSGIFDPIGCLPCLGAGGSFVQARARSLWSLLDDGTFRVELLVGQARRFQVKRIAVDRLMGVRDLLTDEAGRYVAVVSQIDPTEGDRLVLIDLRRQRAIRSIAEATRIHAVALSTRHDLLVVGRWQTARFYSLGRDHFRGALYGLAGDVAWAAVAGDHLAVLTDSGEGRVLRIDPLSPPDGWPERRTPKLSFEQPLSLADGDQPTYRRVRASLSPDGRLLAVREGSHRLTVVDLASGDRQELGGHTDRINLIKFVDGGQRLISADLDNRVICWPRGPDGRLISKRVRRRDRLAL